MPLSQNASTLFLLAVGMQSIQLIETESAADMHITHPLFDLIFFFGLLDDVEPHHAPACKETLEQIFFFHFILFENNSEGYERTFFVFAYIAIKVTP